MPFAARSSASAKRNPKACEACRSRKTRCVGGQPCMYCKAIGTEEQCVVRSKARPGRSSVAEVVIPGGDGDNERPLKRQRRAEDVSPVASKATVADAGVGASEGEMDAGPVTGTAAGTSNLRTGPLTGGSKEDPASGAFPLVERVAHMAREWAESMGMDGDLLCYTDHALILDSGVHIDPATENSLMAFYLQSPQRHFDVGDRQLIEALYERHCLLPASLSGEHRALIYACLCRSAQLHGETMHPIGSHYWQLAAKEIRTERPSLISIGAALLLASYSMMRGGRDETFEMTGRAVEQVRAMGLVKWRTASLYAPGDQVGRLLTAAVYLDTIIAYHCDSPPHIVWAEVDWDPTAGVLLMDWPLRVSRAESAFSVDLAQPTRVAETTTVLENDAHWAQLARAISQANVPPPRTSKEAPANEPTLGWAVIRVYWLQMMSRVRLLDHPLLGPSSWAVATAAAAQILHVYIDHDSTGRLHPCWISFLRIVTCTQFVILAMVHRHLHRVDAIGLLAKAIALMESHVDWPNSGDIAARFKLAVSVMHATLGVSIAGDGTLAQQSLEAVLRPEFESAFDLDWPSIWAEQSTDIMGGLGAVDVGSSIFPELEALDTLF